MLERSSDQGFDSFRRERKRMQAKVGPGVRVLGYENEALRALEAVEAREVREQQLTREVHEFFAAATRQAASIVERVAKDAEVVAGQRIEREMEAFLIDALARMNTFVLTVLHRRQSQVAEQQMEPRVGNLVGQPLDEFRWAGTADVGDKHIGQDPFATDVADVCRELRETMKPPPVSASIEEHLVADAGAPDAPPDEPAPESAPEPPMETAAGPSPEPSAELPQEPPTASSAAPETGLPPAAAAPVPQEELEKFKSMLKSLVQQGTMTRMEARAAWETRLQSLGLLPS